MLPHRRSRQSRAPPCQARKPGICPECIAVPRRSASGRFRMSIACRRALVRQSVRSVEPGLRQTPQRPHVPQRSGRIPDGQSSPWRLKPATALRLMPRDGFPSFRGDHDAARYSVVLTAIRPIAAASCHRSVDVVHRVSVYCQFGRLQIACALLDHRSRDRIVVLGLVSSRSSCRDVFSGSSFPDEAASMTSALDTVISLRQLHTEISVPS